jgi:hypothetical protein
MNIIMFVSLMKIIRADCITKYTIFKQMVWRHLLSESFCTLEIPILAIDTWRLLRAEKTDLVFTSLLLRHSSVLCLSHVL